VSQRQIPGGAFLNETGSGQYQSPGGEYVNETTTAGSDFTATGDLVAQSSAIAGDSVVGRTGTGDLVAQSSVIEGSASSDADVVVEVAAGRAASSPRRRYRIIEDPDLIQEEIKVEEKKVEVEKRKLRVLIKRVESPNVEGVLYQQIQEKIEKLEAKIDDRLEKIAGLMLSIQVALDEQDDDEEEIFLLS
jgi:hypothetical protein